MRTQEKILQSAIHCLANLGYQNTTFQSIANHCGLSQPLVVHYFKKKENVFPAVIEYLAQRTRSILNTEVVHDSSPADRLRDFVRVSIGNARKEAEPARILLTLSFLAVFDEKFRPSNGQIKQIVINDLTEILLAGVKAGQFDVSEVTLTAKLITSYIMGVRMNLLNEMPVVPDETLIAAAEKHCLAIVGYRGE